MTHYITKKQITYFAKSNENYCFAFQARGIRPTHDLKTRFRIIDLETISKPEIGFKWKRKCRQCLDNEINISNTLDVKRKT